MTLTPESEALLDRWFAGHLMTREGLAVALADIEEAAAKVERERLIGTLRVVNPTGAGGHGHPMLAGYFPAWHLPDALCDLCAILQPEGEP